MKFKVEINTEFDKDPGAELARILDDVSNRVRLNLSFTPKGNGVRFKVRDRSGNKCGSFHYSGVKR